ncbi:hypothetical protein HDA32_002106 [Spinactinospora alkalitolerans]|uniref:Uncharacterized protein n=1 Tax=Spinactinospora alkalitolerans TaxID=687207 RepID=A0A852TRG6_9ACTN|nr:hypothetical protein [Spinactinospora alkalitolerans]
MHHDREFGRLRRNVPGRVRYGRHIAPLSWGHRGNAVVFALWKVVVHLSVGALWQLADTHTTYAASYVKHGRNGALITPCDLCGAAGRFPVPVG